MAILSDARRCAWLAAFALLSCSGVDAGPSETRPSVGTVAQALTDTDGDGMDDDWETLHFGNLSQTDTGDFDSDGMTNGEEFLHGFNPTVNDAFDDADGDRYPNVFEIKNGADPNAAGSLPTPNFVVNGAGGGTHTTVGDAMNAANVANGTYQIIGIAPGVYVGNDNLRGVTLPPTKPKLLFIGLEGARKTIIDGELVNYGWKIQNSAVISSLTFRRAIVAHVVDAPGQEVRFVDLVVRDNIGPSWPAAIDVRAITKAVIVGSTFLDNNGWAPSQQITIGAGVGQIENTLIWSQSNGTLLTKSSNATLTTNHCIVKGQALVGTGNLAGNVDPKLRSDAHLLWDSPLRSAGGSVLQSRIDFDGESRPSSYLDIGVDQFVDSDGDGLADWWELEEAGNLTTLTGQSQDADGDGLTNEDEYERSLKPTVGDTDGDGLSDGDEIHLHATNPLKSDTDGDDMPDAWEVAYGLAPLVANGFEDADGDRYPNVFEYVNSTNPIDIQSKPDPDFIVSATGGGTHTTIGDALSSADSVSGAYQIIGIAPGVYTGNANLRGVTLPPTKPKILFIGLEGARETIIDGELVNYGWKLQNSAVVSSLTFRKAIVAHVVDAPGQEIRFVDLIVRDNIGSSWPAAIDVRSIAKTVIVGSTFIDNNGWASSRQITIGAGIGQIENTLIWSQSAGPLLTNASGATLTTNHCLVKGQLLSGAGNLAGNIDPRLRSDLHLLWDSPLREAGGSVSQSRIDLDGELRPTVAPDIGIDQFVDSDNDHLADWWELEKSGDTMILGSQDTDGDGLTDEEEYVAYTNPLLVDTDGDGLSDGDEVHVYATSPLKSDTDGDDMPDGWEVTYGLPPLVANSFEDMDGDRYPNVFEYVNSTNPSDRQSFPTPNYIVDGAGSGTHTTISAALNAASVTNGAYQIIGIAPGVYKGGANLRDVTVAAIKPKLLFIGLEGAAKTIIDGENANLGWVLRNAAVVSSLTFQKTYLGIWVDVASQEARFVDLIFRDNRAIYNDAAGLQVHTASNVHVVNSTFYNNVGRSDGQHVYVENGTTNLTNVVIWNVGSGTFLGGNVNASLVANNCLVKGQLLAGVGNLPGDTDPRFRSDLHLLWDSPLREAGKSVPQSRVDLDSELRPDSAPDIGVDQFNDVDGDGLADQWEMNEAGDLTTLTGRTQDADGDGLSNEEEYANYANPLVADSDGDGLSDGDEIHLYDTSPLKIDTDDDDMPDAWEVAYGLDPRISSAFEDADGDRYPNVFEYVNSTNPTDRQSVPVPNYIVDGSGGGTHTTISAALNAANVTAGSYQIIGIAPGIYKGGANLRDVMVAATKPKLLFIGLEGAAKTIIDGENANLGWVLRNAAVVSSLTFQRTYLGIWVDVASQEARFVDLVFRDNRAIYNDAAGLQVHTASKIHIVNSTFFNNVGRSDGQHIYAEAGVTNLTNVVIWDSSSGTFLGHSVGAAFVANNCLIKGQDFTGAGNLPGNTNPKFRSDLRTKSGSPLRAAGKGVSQSRIDMDGELRPLVDPDIGADQFVDSDDDGLPDSWEIATAGNISTIDGAADEDNDGLSNAAEYDLETNWLDPDTDKDGLKDGVEVAIGTNPLVVDADEPATDLNGDGLIDSIGAQLGYQPDQLDDDGDSISNADEALMGTNPTRADSDGDGVPDNLDAFPLDPFRSALVSDPQDVTPPTITLTAPWYAVEQ